MAAWACCPRSNNCAVASTLWSCPGRSSITYARAPSICRPGSPRARRGRRLFDMGFIPDIRQIVSYVPAQRQTLLFAATMPDDVRRLAHDILSDPITIQVGPMGPTPTVSHVLYPVEPQHKTTGLLALLRHTDLASVLVFTRTKQRAKRVAQQLASAGYGATACRATCRSVSVRPPSMASEQGHFRSW